MPYWGCYRVGVALPNIGYIGIKLEFVAVGIKNVDAVGYGVIPCSNDENTFFLQFMECALGVFG